MVTSGNFRALLNSISSTMETPVVIALLLLIVVTVFVAGTVIAEIFTERKHLARELKDVLEKIKDKGQRVGQAVEESLLPIKQKEAFKQVTDRTDLSKNIRESLAVRAIENQQHIYDRRVRTTDVIARIGPMLGLLGTLIPLGPGIIALGRGDTLTLSMSLQTAFDTTIAGLLCAAVALIISTIRKSWYGSYMSYMECIMEFALEEDRDA